MSNRRRARIVGAAQRPVGPEDWIAIDVPIIDMDERAGIDDLSLRNTRTGEILPVSKLLAAGVSIEEIVAATFARPRPVVESQPDAEPEVPEIPTEQESPVMEESISTEDLDEIKADVAGRKWGQQDTCRYCGKTMGLFGLPRHESRCDKNPDRTESDVLEAVTHTDDEYGRCPRCDRSMLLTSIDQHLLAYCPIVQYEKRHGISLDPDVWRSTHPTAQFKIDLGMAEKMSTSTTDDDLYAVLEMLAPAGIKPRMIPLVQDWVAVTKKLLEELR